MTGLPVVESCLCLCCITHVEGEQLAIAATELEGVLCLCLIAGVIDDNLIALLGKSYADGTSDATAAACYKCIFTHILIKFT